MVDKEALRFDHPTLQHAIQLLENRLQAVVAYGSGGCPTCHDAELRGAIATLKRMMVAAVGQVAATSGVRRK
jgi:hypothetical protein